MIVNLSHRALICVSGADAQDFLHKQLSNDVLNLPSGQTQLNAYCTHQGRIIALLRVFCLDDNYYLSFPNDLKQLLVKRLTMFVLNAQMVLKDVSNDFVCLGFLDEKPPSNLGKLIKYSPRQTLVLLTKKTDISHICLDDYQQWLLADIEQKQPEISLATTEIFVPQMLNLDLVETGGVNFEKGCYPGQEVVARLHYLGKAKRRLIKLKYNGIGVNVGDKLTIKKSQSLKESGRIVLIAQISNITYCLATIEVSLGDEIIYLADKIMERIND